MVEPNDRVTPQPAGPGAAARYRAVVGEPGCSPRRSVRPRPVRDRGCPGTCSLSAPSAHRRRPACAARLPAALPPPPGPGAPPPPRRRGPRRPQPPRPPTGCWTAVAAALCLDLAGLREERLLRGPRVVVLRRPSPRPARLRDGARNGRLTVRVSVLVALGPASLQQPPRWSGCASRLQPGDERVPAPGVRRPERAREPVGRRREGGGPCLSRAKDPPWISSRPTPRVAVSRATSISPAGFQRHRCIPGERGARADVRARRGSSGGACLTCRPALAHDPGGRISIRPRRPPCGVLSTAVASAVQGRSGGLAEAAGDLSTRG